MIAGTLVLTKGEVIFPLLLWILSQSVAFGVPGEDIGEGQICPGDEITPRQPPERQVSRGR